ncbi:PREDICTED: probable U3 small nucleolar RNA-associated protein 7 [Rhagoletis zephyria]|uniref:probable U3 small nucleolar RNA-associated protein 7 n=1 Tax=Rhagoletis zephyria TaxID=28612 RepID=UPI0008116196|nr:PREDICTED: probable U3 small nucleolar RNA-associated protein 7 [Rhagoletis zephyria]
MPESEVTDQKQARLNTSGPKRYFQSPLSEDEVKPIKLKNRSQQNFSGEVIKVELNKQLPFKKSHRKLVDKKTIKKEIPEPKIPKGLLQKYSKGEKVKSKGVKTKFFKEKLQRKEIYLEYATEQAARTELLLTEQQGFIEPDEEELTAQYRQEEISQNVDILAASKHFKLNLDFGPYSMRYTKNGRHLLLGGRRGHVAAFDWVTKKLLCEINVMEEVVDVSWLHVHTMFACAQKDWVYFYDNQGTELHCVKRLYRVNCMEFLPYHFLLATGNKDGYASWLDVSIGELVSNFNTKLGDIRIMRHNPGNGVMCIGGGKGVVSMWSPKVREPLSKLLCHSTPMSALCVDPKGQYMVTAGQDRKVKVWDIRALKGPIVRYQLRYPANQIEVSQRGALAYSQGTYCEIQSNLLLGNKAKTPYLRQTCDSFVHCMRFCPYEDVLGVATAKGFQSLLVPGSGEPNYDALEDNPYQTKSQRREHEVHALLEKIPPELITLNPNEISNVDVPTLQEKVDAKRALFHVKPPKIDFKARHKMKGRGGSAKASRNKQIVKDIKRKEFIEGVKKSKQAIVKQHTKNATDFIPLETSEPSVLDRFKPKDDRK